MGSPWDAVHMAAALAGCRKALVGTGLAISLLLTQTGIDKALLPLYIRGFISGTVGNFQSGDGRRALTIVSSLMSGRGRGHEP